NITDAKVVYRVRRKVIFPAWYYWRRPNIGSESQEITNGETVSDASGNFYISFMATPDKSVDKENLPVFTYEITADVTDVNGETRSATTNVKVGYHAMVATISMNETIDRNSKKTAITIDTKNLNGEFEPAKGTFKIYKLKAPKNPLRERPWNTPGFQDISEKEFRKMFPNEAYFEDENKDENWKKGALVFNETFNTKQSKEIDLKDTKKWESGKYIAILESEDKFGNAIKDQKKITLFSPKDKKVADNQLFVIKINKNSYQPNENVALQIGTASKNMHVVLQIEKNYKIIETKIIRLKNEIKTIKIPVRKSDIGGFAIKYHFVNYNYFKSGSLLINVPKKETAPIEIITNVFRDKLQPGAEETWSFSIKNDKNDAITAEVLASMYDVSLDEFKPHNWQFNPIATKTNYYSYQTSSANRSFGVAYFNMENSIRSYYHIPNINYASYNWFGFSFQNNNWLNRQYVRNLKRKLQRTRKDFDGIITGVVEDVNGEPLPGVSILIKGTDFKADTDFDGNYKLKIKKGDVLVYSYLGYKTKEVVVNSQTNIDLALQEDANALDEVVVMGYGTTEKKSLTGSVSFLKAENEKSSLLNGFTSGVEVMSDNMNWNPQNTSIKFRGNSTISKNENPLIVIDGVVMTQADLKSLNPNNLAEITVLKNSEATALYGSRGANGVVVITSKKALEKQLAQVKARKNFKETAFFFPQLKTDKNGKVSFTFTMPEALTRWKLQLLAHTKELKTASKTLSAITQKELMVVPNAPRFLREGDDIILSAKISNLTNNTLNGFAKLYLTDAISGKEINIELKNINSNKNFTIDKDGNTNVSWSISIPNTVQAVQYKIVAKAGAFSDGEQNVLPVLSNRMLVTETLPMFIRSNETKTFTLEKLKNTSTKLSEDSSSTLKNHQLTLEMTSNPVWYAIQSLPFLMEYPYECAEQTFARYYANTLASFVANSNPKIQAVFNAWKSSDALLSNLEKNQELKSIIIQETPWLRDAQSETEQKKRIALLFDLNKMKNEQEKAINKLQEMQMNSGGFPWFKGSRYANNYITQHIATGFGHLQKIGVMPLKTSTKNMIAKSVAYLDGELLKQYRKLLDRAEKTKALSKNTKKGAQAYKEFLAKNNLNYFTIQYLYMRSFYKDIPRSNALITAVNYYQNQTIKFWNDYNLYAKGQIALSLFRSDKKTVANQILKSLKENSITSNELGMYWKSNVAGYYFYQAPVETHALMIAVFTEIENDEKTIDNLKIWLLKNKQTNRWKTTKATTEAVYALLLSGSDWTAITEMVAIKVGEKEINPSEIDVVKVEAGTGYFKTSWNGEEIEPKMGDLTITKKEKGIAWGGLYWQYFEDLDKITTSKSHLQLNKKLFLKVNSDTGKKLQEITKNTKLKVGDLITVRIELSTDRNMEFIHLKDMRAAGFEPVNFLSKYKWQDNLGYYQSTKDAATNFFFERIPKGIYVFEYDVRVNNAGNFSNGITTIQSMYAPEFSSYSKGIRVSVDN
ncbi:carboxypeptidase-like regulatory domain-containing protein, partial [Polaribacter sp.]|uniref:alpha-2-macroglobulin family protein n=1 Tax=Polaribacter sp. TaxID=1920175 RepID=UPI003F6D7849